jgi:hypothetical protein
MNQEQPGQTDKMEKREQLHHQNDLATAVESDSQQPEYRASCSKLSCQIKRDQDYGRQIIYIGKEIQQSQVPSMASELQIANCELIVDEKSFGGLVDDY